MGRSTPQIGEERRRRLDQAPCSTDQGRSIPATCSTSSHPLTEFVLRVRKEVERGKLPPDVADNFENLYYNYKNEVLQNGDPNAYQIMLSNMMDLFDRILLDAESPFTFQPYHKAIREPFDYYTFGQNYIRPLVDFRYKSGCGLLPCLSSRQRFSWLQVSCCIYHCSYTISCLSNNWKPCLQFSI
ncbi:hypothetical protein CFC21_039566 [Triticum aestivum]|uniref:glycerol-3-phosphate 1-O-acyltransferase n=2 Tax=Triticum aestivum TaxID=4565 RepID=A0A9R1FFK2_WHEAT|nr:glycerol-3-phosphate acyltransferase ATS11, chloroplastic-like [Triticum aestivum]KAF7027533.1 hypothetical protein CFC21_039566 [Triticum aestivum]